jgi:hypothetical protein
MNTKRLNLLVLALMCIFLSSAANAYWHEIVLPDPIDYDADEDIGPIPSQGAFESGGYGQGGSGYGFAAVDTRAYADGEYWYWQWIGDRYYYLRGDTQSETSGWAFGWGDETRSWEWIGYESPICDPFVVRRTLTVMAYVAGDAGNWDLSAGTVSVTSSATVSVSLSTGPYKDVSYSGVKTFSENSTFCPDGLTITIGPSGGSVALEWDDPAGWVDDSFSDNAYRQEFFTANVTTEGFSVTLSGTVDSDATSSNNAEKAYADGTASAGY